MDSSDKSQVEPVEPEEHEASSARDNGSKDLLRVVVSLSCRMGEQMGGLQHTDFNTVPDEKAKAVQHHQSSEQGEHHETPPWTQHHQEQDQPPCD